MVNKLCINPEHPWGDHEHENGEVFARIVFFSKQDPSLTGPPCIWDNSPTRRAGSCFVCPLCGSSTSC